MSPAFYPSSHQERRAKVTLPISQLGALRPGRSRQTQELLVPPFPGCRVAGQQGLLCPHRTQVCLVSVHPPYQLRDGLIHWGTPSLNPSTRLLVPALHRGGVPEARAPPEQDGSLPRAEEGPSRGGCSPSLRLPTAHACFPNMKFGQERTGLGQMKSGRKTSSRGPPLPAPHAHAPYLKDPLGGGCSGSTSGTCQGPTSP